jgi:pentatricopeptide repeat protein
MEPWTALLGVLAWPVVVVVALVLFRHAIRDLLSRDDVSFSGPAGIAVSARRATGALVTAQEIKAGTVTSGGATRPTSWADVDEQVREVAEFVRRSRRSPRILWVDDTPSQNRFERTALENMGMVVDLCTSTAPALEQLRNRGPYDVVISNMAREGDVRAGYTLLEQMRHRGDRTPFVVYSESDLPEHFDEAVRRGAVGSTPHPQELVDMVLHALRDTPPERSWWRVLS